MSEFPDGKPYHGPMSVFRDSLWLTNEDIPHDRDTIVTIEAVIEREDVVFQGGRIVERCGSLKFVGHKREYKINATARKTLELLFGKGADVLYGKQVALFVEQNVRRPDKTRGPAVRIRPVLVDKPQRQAATPQRAPAPAAKPAPRQPGEEGDTVPMWEDVPAPPEQPE